MKKIKKKYTTLGKMELVRLLGRNEHIAQAYKTHQKAKGESYKYLDKMFATKYKDVPVVGLEYLTKQGAVIILEEVFQIIFDALVSGVGVRMTNFGTLLPYESNNRKYYHPKTHELIYEKEREMRVKFVPSENMRSALSVWDKYSYIKNATDEEEFTLTDVIDKFDVGDE